MEVIAEIKAPVVETFVALEIQQEDEAIEQKSEFIHVAEADEQTRTTFKALRMFYLQKQKKINEL